MSIYRAICCSRSSIFARFETFFGFGLGVLGGGVESLCKAISIISVFPLPPMKVKRKHVLC